jgi:hypothetical protein
MPETRASLGPIAARRLSGFWLRFASNWKKERACTASPSGPHSSASSTRPSRLSTPRPVALRAGGPGQGDQLRLRGDARHPERYDGHAGRREKDRPAPHARQAGDALCPGHPAPAVAHGRVREAERPALLRGVLRHGVHELHADRRQRLRAGEVAPPAARRSRRRSWPSSPEPGAAIRRGDRSCPGPTAS